MREAINFIWKVSVFGQLAVAARLLSQGLAGEYPALTTACCVLPIKSLLLMLSYVHTVPAHQMRQAAEYLSPIEWILCAWIVFELFSRWTGSYQGIGRFGKLVLAFLLGGALLISIAVCHVEWQALVFAHSFRIYYILDRIVWATLALFVVGTWLFFRNYPVAIAPNVVRHTYISVVYFSVTAVCLLVFTLTGMKFLGEVNLTKTVVGAGCFLSWATLLVRKGQVAPPVQKVTPEDRERIERINQELLVFMGNFPKQGR